MERGLAESLLPRANKTASAQETGNFATDPGTNEGTSCPDFDLSFRIGESLFSLPRCMKEKKIKSPREAPTIVSAVAHLTGDDCGVRDGPALLQRLVHGLGVKPHPVVESRGDIIFLQSKANSCLRAHAKKTPHLS